MNSKLLPLAGRILYGLGMAAIGVQQMFYGQFARILFPTWKENVPGEPVIAAVGSILLILAGLGIAFLPNPRKIALALGGILLVLFVFSYIPYDLWFIPIEKSFGIWTNAFKEFALAGGAFVVAGTLPAGENVSGWQKLSGKLIPAGPVFFAFTITSFGIMHFLYVPFVATLVPAWVGAATFWTYLTGGLLVASGLAIGLNLLRRPAALALALMLFLWIVMLHIPRAIADPKTDRGNEVVAAFTAIAFCGISLSIAAGKTSRRRLIA